LLFLLTLAAVAQEFDPDPAWPLCGNIADAPPDDWRAEDGCPPDRRGAAFADGTIMDAFGPRVVGGRYDFHRGLDMATPVGTPVFAIADGWVQRAGDDPSFDEPVVEVQHARPGQESCVPAGCYASLYMHLTEAVVDEGERVVEGQLIGFSGETDSGFEHLHLEIRSAPVDEPESSWRRDAVDPLRVLPVAPDRRPRVKIHKVDASDPLRGVVDVTVVGRRDLASVSVTLLDRRGLIVPQPGDVPDAKGYVVHPSSYEPELWNRLYTHKDNDAVPWEAFGVGGERECPFADEHPRDYAHGVHLDATLPDVGWIGSFNGVVVDPDRFVDRTPLPVLSLTFTELVGPATCVWVRAETWDGAVGVNSWGDCD
jgi:murein DD-endopeptidase MepM/ murein hydrolase activator NlpD